MHSIDTIKYPGAASRHIFSRLKSIGGAPFWTADLVTAEQLEAATRSQGDLESSRASALVAW